jgi:putative endonuclease
LKAIYMPFLARDICAGYSGDMPFAYTYVLKCADGDMYTGSTDNLSRRIAAHEKGECRDTAKRLPLEMIYCEACRSLVAARLRERQLKTGFGRGYLRRRLAFEFKLVPRNAGTCPPS